ncbi:uncharacterized protein LOC105191094 isoform X2 [Harpegnathos saltator]|uniref:uncharacterized protein LOC105191094 isoform X2 n=1 Tax=Harpegnathos saltator TaxID=610380 RepID=UPI000DBEF069|nr:uncharacterized protein LOC105191094 isoform X2 [Harpegnathos saltator]
MAIFQRTKISESSKWTNGNGNFAAAVMDEKPTTFWRKLRINEWTFSVSLFLFSLSMTLGKLYFNYGESLSWQIGDQLLASSGTLLDASNQYTNAAAGVLVTFYKKYWWFVKAALSGLAITSFTWFIIYMDSSIPGVNPPSPFSSSRQRNHVPLE